MRRKRMIALVLPLLVAGCGSGPATQQATGRVMGTTYTMKAVSRGADATHTKTALDLAVEAVQRVEALMSTYDPESELSRFNAYQETEPFPLSEDTFRVFSISRQVSDASGGAFDVTVGPLVNAWGFGSQGSTNQPPPEDELIRIGERVGYAMLELDPHARTIRKARPGMYCDLAAVAKGYGVDAAAGALNKAGIQDYMVEVGGEVRTEGTNAAGQPWRIAIEKPDPAGRSIERVVPLSGQSLATSGDYRNYFEADGHRFSHTIDPRSRRPIEHKLASVSVMHKECAYADAYATALMVLGPEEGMKLAEERDLSVLMIVHAEDGRFEERESSAFTEFIVNGVLAAQPASDTRQPPAAAANAEQE